MVKEQFDYIMVCTPPDSVVLMLNVRLTKVRYHLAFVARYQAVQSEPLKNDGDYDYQLFKGNGLLYPRHRYPIRLATGVPRQAWESGYLCVASRDIDSR